MTIEDVLALLTQQENLDTGIVLDDGEYYIEAENEGKGLLLRICDLALLEEDDAECHGGYQRREDGSWEVGFCVEAEPGATTLEHGFAKANDREHAIAMLWLIRHSTVGYRTGRRAGI